MDVAWLHKYASELVQKEVEDKWAESDRVRDEQKEGARERRRKETKKGRRGHTSHTAMAKSGSVSWRRCT